MNVGIRVSSPEAALEEVAAHYEREYFRLNSAAARTTGRDKRDLIAQASYASRQIPFWRNMQVLASEQAQ